MSVWILLEELEHSIKYGALLINPQLCLLSSSAIMKRNVTFCIAAIYAFGRTQCVRHFVLLSPAWFIIPLPCTVLCVFIFPFSPQGSCFMKSPVSVWELPLHWLALVCRGIQLKLGTLLDPVGHFGIRNLSHNQSDTRTRSINMQWT